MGLGFKYHVVTIAAIFFALTIGLVVGSLYVSPRIPRQTLRAIESLQKSQTLLDKNNLELKQERDTLQNCLRQSLPYALKGRLSGQTVAVVQTGGNRAGGGDARDALTEAGAQVTSLTIIEHSFEQPDEILLPRLTEQHNGDSRFPTDRNSLAARVAAVFQAGDTGGMMPLLQTAGLLRAEADSSYALPTHTLVLVTGSQSEASGVAANVDVPLIDALQKAGITVVACEAQDVVTSSFPTYRAANLRVGTVEKVDTDPGRWLLVSELSNPAH